MKPSDDITSPKTQLRLWRRVWIGVAAFVVLAPILMWLAIDYAGQRALSDVKARLREHGEATSIAELNLPSRQEVPDAENFCALPWLMVKRDGSASAAMLELREQLAVFSGSHDSLVQIAEARGNPRLGFPDSLSVLAQSLDMTAEEEGFKFDQGMMEEAGDDPVARILTYLNVSGEFWQAAEAARLRPYAFFLPDFEERLAANDGLPVSATGSVLSFNDTFRALAARIASALHAGDDEMLLRSLEIGQRCAEACGNEPVLISPLVALSGFAFCQGGIIECLWTDRWQGDAEKLRRLQAVVAAWSLDEMTARAVRSEVVGHIETLQWLGKNGVDAFGALTGNDSDFLRSLMPSGWLDANAAYTADLIDRHLLDACRRGSYADVLAATRTMESEVDDLNRFERWHRYLGVIALYPYPRIIERMAYGEACRRQALIACALYRYRIDHDGNFPAVLDALVPGYLDRVSNDPIDGAAMRYALSADGSFELYSIGHDGHDDGGTLNLDANLPQRTRVQQQDYVGDWPWPVVPRPAEEASDRDP